MSLIKKVEEAKTTRQITPKVANCIEIITRGFVGRYQWAISGKTYCSNSQEYCPIQYNCEKGIPCCNGDKLLKEYVSKHPKNEI